MDAMMLIWAFKALIAGVCFYIIRLLDKLVKSLEALNIKVAVIIEQVSGHEKRLNSLESEEKKRKK